MELPPPTPFKRFEESRRGRAQSFRTGISRRRGIVKPFLVLVWLAAYIYVLVSSGATATDGFKQLACTSVHWTNAYQCGLDGHHCRPFEGPEFHFRCPSRCSVAHLSRPVAVGGQIINRRPLVVGGGYNTSSAAYRGDSFICGAAIHAGIFEDARGGCGILHREGESRDFVGSRRNGIDSIAFDASFPLSFSLRPAPCVYADPRWKLLSWAWLGSLLVPWLSRSAGVCYSTVMATVFFHIALVANPPDEPAISNFKDVISSASGKFLPAAALASLVYGYVVKEAQREITKAWHLWAAWTAGLWSGALCNVLEQHISDLRHLETRVAVLLLACLTTSFVGKQALQFYRHRQLSHHVKYYVLVALSWLVAAGLCHLAGFHLHLHHYLWPLPLLRGTLTSDISASFFQGLLQAISADGVARWGFGQLFEVCQATTPSTSIAHPTPRIPIPVIDGSHIRFRFAHLDAAWIGVSILINDVLRLHNFREGNDTLGCTVVVDPVDAPFYFRCSLIAYSTLNPFRGLEHFPCRDIGVMGKDRIWSVLEGSWGESS